MNELRLLYIEDDERNREDLKMVLDGDEIGGYTIKMDVAETFEDAITVIKSEPYHIVILDIFRGNPQDGGIEEGLSVLTRIQETLFVPVIFYSGNTKNVRDLESQIVGIVTKGDDGIEGLKRQIYRFSKSNLPFIKYRVHEYLESEFKTYFWDIIHSEREIFKPQENDFSLGYLMLRKFSTSLSKERISKVIGDNRNGGKAHPMEFYLYPTDASLEYESGEILQNDNDVYVILTPSCDFVNTDSRKRKADKVLLAKTFLLTDSDEYKKYILDSTKKNKDSFCRLIESRKGDRYFFLPKTPFMDNRIIDFQITEMEDYKNLRNLTRIAKLDSPFAESMISSFTRYYNRIGYPDIDSDLIIQQL